MQTEDPALERHFRGHRGPVTCLTFNPAQKQLASGSKDSTIMIWNFRQSVRAFRFYGHKDAVLDVSYSPSGHLLASASQDRTVRLWTPTIHGNSTEFHAHTSAVRSIHFSSNGQYFVTGSNDKSVKIWSAARRNRFVSSITGHGNWVRCARFSPDGRLVASCSDDHTTRLHDIRENGTCGSNPIHTFMESRGCPQKIAFHPSGTCLAVSMSLDARHDGTIGGAIKVYDIRSHKLLQYYVCHDQGQANDVAFHPCGNYLASASDDSTVKIMDLLNGVPMYTLQGHASAVTSVVFSHTGEHFATGGADNQILMWKTKFDKIIDSLCSKVTLRDPIEKLAKSVNNVSLTSTAGSENPSHLPHHVNASQSVLNPAETEIQITDVSPVSHPSDEYGSDIEVMEVKKVDIVSDRHNDKMSHHLSREDAEDSSSCADKGVKIKSRPENCFQMQKVMDTLLNMNEQIETLRQTVVLLEQRITMVEDQLQNRESISTSG